MYSGNVDNNLAHPHHPGLEGRDLVRFDYQYIYDFERGPIGKKTMAGETSRRTLTSDVITFMGTLRQDIDTAAEWVAKALRSSNYRANFSPQSLWDIDLFFDDHSENGAPKPKGLLSEHLGSRLFSLGAYVGEVVRRGIGGQWQTDDSDSKREINIALKLPDGSVIWPVQRIMKRLKNGPVEGIAGYGAALGLAVGQKLEPFSPYRG